MSRPAKRREPFGAAGGYPAELASRRGLGDWLEPRHPAYFVSEVVDGFDLSAIYGSYTELRGYPPYEPKMMVKVWLYAYMVGIHSSRKVERALHEDVGFRVLSANQQPD